MIHQMRNAVAPDRNKGVVHSVTYEGVNQLHVPAEAGPSHV